MAYDGSIKIDTSINGSGIAKGVQGITNSIKGIAGALGVVKMVSASFDMLKGSVSSAMNRSDTMEQFNRTMSQMTGDTQAAKGALEDLKVTTKGTAYGLDVAAKATQNFVTRGMQMDKATQQVGVWADAVAFYGKGTNEQLENVTDALAKMRTKGTIEMDQLNRLFDVGIDAVGMYAKVTGQSSSEVQTALSKGAISANDFIDVVTNAMANGTNGVQKISGAAKEAGASWQGTFDNMKAACTRGVLGIIEAVDNGLKSINLPTIRETVAEFGRGVESALGRVAEAVGSTIQKIGPPVVSAFDTFKDAFKSALPPIKEIVNAVDGFVQEVARSLQSGGLKQAIKSTGEIFTSLAKVTANLAKTVLPIFAKAIDFVGGNLKALASIAGGLLVTIKAYKVIQDITTKTKAMATAIKAASNAQKLIIATAKAGTAQTIKDTVATQANTVAITTKQAAVGLLTGKIKLAKIAQAVWNATMVANPIGAIITLVAGLATGIGVLCIALSDSDTSAKAFTETAEAMGKGVDSFATGLSNAKSHLSEFNDTLFISSEEQQKLQEEMDAVQTGITTICRTATEERRDYTAQEIQQLDEYFAKLNELEQRELEVQKEKAKSVQTQAEYYAQAETESLAEYQQRAQEWIATTKEQADKQMEVINQQKIFELEAIRTKHTHRGVLDQEAYQKDAEKLIEAKDAEKRTVEESVGEIAALYAESYAERANLSDLYRKKVGEGNFSMENEDQRHADKLKEISERNYSDENQRHIAIQAETSHHNKNIQIIWAELTSGMSDEEKSQMGVLLGMCSQAELYGGKLNDETISTVNGILGAYEIMPKKTRKAMSDAMSPMLDEMEKAEPTLFQKALNVGNGIIKRLKTAFQEHSPSRATRKIFRYLWEGAEIGTDEKAPTLLKQAASVGKSVLSVVAEALNNRKPLTYPIQATALLSNANVDTSAFVASAQQAVMRSQMRLSANAVVAANKTIINQLDANKITQAVKSGFENTEFTMDGNITTKVTLDGRQIAEAQTPYISRNIGDNITRRKRCNA